MNIHRSVTKLTERGVFVKKIIRGVAHFMPGPVELPPSRNHKKGMKVWELPRIGNRPLTKQMTLNFIELILYRNDIPMTEREITESFLQLKNELRPSFSKTV